MSSSAARSWRRFKLISTGGSHGVQEKVVHTLTTWGHCEVTDVQDADYVLVFCPITSRVGSDISEAESYMPGDRPVVLVVLRHTFHEDPPFIPSEHIVQKPNVHLAVDMLFHRGALLQCEHNKQAWDLLSLFFRGVKSKRPEMFDLLKITLGILITAVFIVAVVWLIYTSEKNEKEP